MTVLLTILHVVVCFVLILVVLAQQGKGQDLASAFGGGGSSAAFGARGAATFLAKVTTGAAILFMLTSLGLSYFRPAMGGGSVVPPDEPAQTAPSGVSPEETPPIEGMDPLEEPAEAEPATPAEGASEGAGPDESDETAQPDQP